MEATRAIRQVRPATDAITPDLFAELGVRLKALALEEVLVRPQVISVDPYLVLRFRDNPFPDGAVRSRLIGVVEASRASGIREGDTVLGFGEWQERVIMARSELRVLKPRAPLPAYLGVIGHSGYTALLGMQILDVQCGHTFSVSSAAGMVGMVAGQLAKLAGAKVIGIAGGNKADRLEKLLSFDRGVDHRKGNLLEVLQQAAPNGIDRHFENVGSAMLDPVICNANDRARIALCGMIAHYADRDPIALANFRQILVKGISISGFNIAHHLDGYAQGLAYLEDLFLAGRLQGHEVISKGLESLPAAMMALLAGEGFGKHMVRLE